MTFTPATKEKKFKLITKLKFGSLNLFFIPETGVHYEICFVGYERFIFIVRYGGLSISSYVYKCLSACCVHTTYVPVAFGSQKVASDHLELEFQNVESYCLVTGN